VLKPETAVQWEGGLKADLLDRRLRFTAAAIWGVNGLHCAGDTHTTSVHGHPPVLAFEPFSVARLSYQWHEQSQRGGHTIERVGHWPTVGPLLGPHDLYP